MAILFYFVKKRNRPTIEHLLAEAETADADDCYADNQGCCSNNHHDNQHCNETAKHTDLYKHFEFHINLAGNYHSFKILYKHHNLTSET